MRVTFKKQFFFALIGFCLFFYLCDIPTLFFFLLLDIILLTVFLLFKNSASVFFTSVLFITISCIISYFTIHILRGHILRMPTCHEYGLVIVAMLFCMDYYSRTRDIVSDKASTRDELFKEQENDITRLYNYILQFPLLGISAKWGNGKSFVWTHIKTDTEICKVFDIIQIDLLSIDLDSVELVLINELERLLERHQIHPQSSQNLKTLLGHTTWLQWIAKLFNDNNAGLSMSFDTLLQELKLIKKKILICYEDVDRIADAQQIKKIFAISEKISSEQVHVVFQYNIDLLYSIDNGSIGYDYMEKYIPFTVSLTEISYQNMMQKLWICLDMESIPLDPKKVYNIGFIIPNFWVVNSIWGCDCQKLTSTKIHVNSLVSIRKARNYLLELKSVVLSNELFIQNGSEETVAYVLFIKHFFPKDYNLLTVGESPLETFYFEYNDTRYTLPELLKKYERLDKARLNDESENNRLQDLLTLLEKPDNGHKLTLLMLLGYNFSFSADSDEESGVQKQRIEEKNSKIDHVIWNLIANGNSELTDAENDIAQLKEIVLAQSPENWDQGWKTFQENRFYGKFPKNNTTVARMGHGPFMDTFWAMQVTNSAKEIQSRFLPIFFSLYRKRNNMITVELLICLSCCELTEKRDFFEILQFFNSLSVEYNPASANIYRVFFYRYMGAICTLGYAKHLESWMFKLPSIQSSQGSDTLETLIANAQQSLDNLMQVLVDLRARKAPPYSLPCVQAEYDILITFIKKNQELLMNRRTVSKSNINVTVKSFSRRWYNQDEVDRLLKLKEEDPNKFEQELQESYQAGRLYLQELKFIVSEASKSNKLN